MGSIQVWLHSLLEYGQFGMVLLLVASDLATEMLDCIIWHGDHQGMFAMQQASCTVMASLPQAVPIAA
jgi:hypothetical protein